MSYFITKLISVPLIAENLNFRTRPPLPRLLFLQGELYAFTSELEVDPLGRRLEFDYDTVLILHRRDAGSPTNCALCRSACVSAVEVTEFCQVIDLADCACLCDPDINYREPTDFERIVFPLEGQDAIPPTPSNAHANLPLRER